ncbi:MAG TPA: hypothetical protein VJ161_00735 [Geobacteraceae bacterium]|nr:hypothetical protein [Geobacteraceae bacterium]
MKCPKCNARIGMTKQKLATDTGFASGVICYICGYWKQEFSRNYMDFPTQQKQAAQR